MGNRTAMEFLRGGGGGLMALIFFFFWGGGFLVGWGVLDCRGRDLDRVWRRGSCGRE